MMEKPGRTWPGDSSLQRHVARNLGTLSETQRPLNSYLPLSMRLIWEKEQEATGLLSENKATFQGCGVSGPWGPEAGTAA